jgi:hypothetical protein
VKSTGKLGIVISKSEKNSSNRLQRTVTVRREKAGWKVLDISSPIEFQGFRNPNNRNRNQGSGR